MIIANLRKEFRKLSSQELLDKVHELGLNYEKYSGSCSQSVVAAIHEMVEMDDVVVRVASSSCGGQFAQVVGTCGALIGGTIALDYFWGRPANEMSRQIEKTGNLELHIDAMTVATPLFYKFVDKYGSILCPHIQMRIFGRLYYLSDEDEVEKFEKVGGHEDKCGNVVGNSARWTMETLLDKGAVRI
jgi:C_GCAxxG_C_C family probable redox protein